MRYIESPYNDAYTNMALEEYVFEGLPKTDEYFMLWQNKNAIVVGKYQNASRTLDFSIFVQPVVRALAQMGVTAEQSGRVVPPPPHTIPYHAVRRSKCPVMALAPIANCDVENCTDTPSNTHR